MNKKIKYLVIIAVLMTACAGPNRNIPSIRFPYQWPGIPGFGGDIDKQKLTEPSGICFHPIRKTLFVVSDEGAVLEMDKDGTPISLVEVPGDLEGITVHPITGFLYILQEGEDIVLEYDPDLKIVLRRFPINRSYGGDPEFLEKREQQYDNGVECVTFVPNDSHPEGGTFYIGNQWDPPCLMEVLVPIKTAINDRAEAHILRVLPFQIDDPSALFYDPKLRLLNVISDADNILYELTLEGKVVRAYAFPGDNQEGLARDDQGFLYIAQDNGGIIKIRDLR